MLCNAQLQQQQQQLQQQHCQNRSKVSNKIRHTGKNQNYYSDKFKAKGGYCPHVIIIVAYKQQSC